MKVPHFTKYGIILDDDLSAEDEEEKREIQKNIPEEEDESKSDEEELEIKEVELNEEYDNLKKIQNNVEEPKKIIPVMPVIEESNLSKEEKIDEKSESVKKESEMKKSQNEEFDSYSDIIRNFEDETQLRQEEIEQFQLPEFIKDQNKLDCLKRINRFYSIISCNKTKNEDFYQNHSFRASWCIDGFVSPAGNKNGFYSLNINKLVIHAELLEKDEFTAKYNYQKYLKDLKKFNEKYKIFFNCFFENYQFPDFESFDKGWNEKNHKDIFMKRIINYIYEYSRHLHSSPDNKSNKLFFQEELFSLSLLDILFGSPSSQIIKLVNSFQKNKVTPDLFDVYTKRARSLKPTDCEAETKILLGKWFEMKAEPVI